MAEGSVLMSIWLIARPSVVRLTRAPLDPFQARHAHGRRPAEPGRTGTALDDTFAESVIAAIKTLVVACHIRRGIVASSRQTTAAARSSSQGGSRGTRWRTELTFYVAIRTS